MKQILLLTLSLTVICFASCKKDIGNGKDLSGEEIILFKDADFHHALLDVREVNIFDYDREEYIDHVIDIDTNRDGQISTNEAQRVRIINLFDYKNDTGLNILSMPEIKYFTSLEQLFCDKNRLVSLDLNNNTALLFLSCYGNNLKELDISGCKVLKSLQCDQNRLTTLDISDNTRLTWVNCSFNRLTTLDLSKNTDLEELDCSENLLTTLDLSKNTHLEEVDCSYNRLTILDLSKNINLSGLVCSDNPLKKIILNKQNKIESFCILDILDEYGDIIEYVD